MNSLETKSTFIKATLLLAGILIAGAIGVSIWKLSSKGKDSKLNAPDPSSNTATKPPGVDVDGRAGFLN